MNKHLDDTDTIEAQPVDQMINGETLLIPDVGPQCEHCGTRFKPRNRSGGKPQRFCSPQCRADFHAQRSQRSPTCSVEFGEDAADHPPEPTPHQRRSMLIAGAEAFDAKIKPETSEEIVGRVIAEGKVKVTPEPEPDFDWCCEQNIVLPEQQATAVYVNPADAVVIRQQAPWDQDEDSFVYVRPEYAIKFCKQVLKAAGYGDVNFAQPSGGGFVDLT